MHRESRPDWCNGRPAPQHKRCGRSAYGPTTLCPNTRECAAHADFLRQRLYCKEVYHYADSGQVAAWYSVTQASRQVTIPTSESPHKLGDSYNPREAGCR